MNERLNKKVEPMMDHPVLNEMLKFGFEILTNGHKGNPAVFKDYGMDSESAIKLIAYIKGNTLVAEYFKMDDSLNLEDSVADFKMFKAIEPDMTRIFWELEKEVQNVHIEEPIENSLREEKEPEEEECEDCKEDEEIIVEADINSSRRRENSNYKLKYDSKLKNYIQKELVPTQYITTDLEYLRHNGWSEFYEARFNMNGKSIKEFNFKVNSRSIYLNLEDEWIDVAIFDYDSAELQDEFAKAMMGFKSEHLKDLMDKLKSEVPQFFVEENETEEDGLNPLSSIREN